MLAKLWEEERTSHASPPKPAKAPAPALPTAVPKSTSKPQPSAVNAAPKPAQPRAAQKPTQAKSASSPAQAQPNSSLWPPQKKGSLAEAAAKWLANLPENAGKTVRKEDLLRILEANPSYVQLCEQLNGLGLKFERSALARELLKAVPDAPKPQAPQQPIPPAPSTANGS
ncbi:hypothetical protein LTR53_018991, partial [Teratosphaeriaceae sp. CCFEE 6253]